MRSMRENHTSVETSFLHELPPMHALEVFLTAARCGTFSRAAKVMYVTQSAVSRQVQQLENHLGLPLFIRHKLGLRLTPEGEALLPVIEDVFGKITQICGSLRNAGQVLTLRMPPTIATRWFLPILPKLRVLMPDFDVRITTYDAWEPRFEDSGIDAAIVQGLGDWPGVHAMPLMSERLAPVCSPGVAAGLKSPQDLAKVPLLHCDPIQGWTRWLDGAGAAKVVSHRGQTFDTLELALSAATRGQGVALGDLNLIGEALADGILMAPFDFVLDRGVSYYLIYPPGRRQLPKIRALCDWLLDEVSAHSELSRNDGRPSNKAVQ